jgi:hypothetical protein
MVSCCATSGGSPRYCWNKAETSAKSWVAEPLRPTRSGSLIMRPTLGFNSGAWYQRSPWRILGAIFARFPSQKTRLGRQGSSEATRSTIPSGKIQPAVITTASFVGDLWVEVVLLPAGMVCPQVGHRRAISAVDCTNSELQTEMAYCAGLSLPLRDKPRVVRMRKGNQNCSFSLATPDSRARLSWINYWTTMNTTRVGRYRPLEMRQHY